METVNNYEQPILYAFQGDGVLLMSWEELEKHINVPAMISAKTTRTREALGIFNREIEKLNTEKTNLLSLEGFILKFDKEQESILNELDSYIKNVNENYNLLKNKELPKETFDVAPIFTTKVEATYADDWYDKLIKINAELKKQLQSKHTEYNNLKRENADKTEKIIHLFVKVKNLEAFLNLFTGIKNLYSFSKDYIEKFDRFKNLAEIWIGKN